MLYRYIAFALALCILDISVDTDHLRNPEFFSSEQKGYDDIDDMVELIVEFIAGNSHIFNDKIDNDSSKESNVPVKSNTTLLLYFESIKANVPLINPLLIASNNSEKNFSIQDVCLDILTPPPNTFS